MPTVVTYLENVVRLLTNEPGDSDPVPFHGRVSAALLMAERGLAEAKKEVDKSEGVKS